MRLFIFIFFLPTFLFSQDFDLIDIDLNSNPIQAKSADIDLDSYIDIVTITTNDELIWYENLGNSSFDKNYIDQTEGSEFKSVSIADFENDGDIDIFTVGFNNLLTAYINTEGNFVKTIIAGDMTLDNSDILSLPSKIEAVNFNEDSQIDFVISQNDIDISAKVFLSNPDSSYYYQNIVNNTFSEQNTLGQILDYENDGDFDFLFGLGSKFQIYSNENSNFVLANEIEVFHFFFDSEYADLDNDGDKDLVVAIGELGVEIFYNLGDNIFSSGNWLYLGNSNNPWSWVNSLKLFDYNNDGFLDLAIAATFLGTDNNENLKLYLNDQNGWFDLEYSHLFPSSSEVFYFDMVDIDGDGDQDFVIPSAVIDGTSSSYKSLSILTNNSTLSIDDYTNKTKNQVYPNPFKDIINLFSESSEKKIIYVYDLNGRLLKTEQIQGNYNKLNLGKFQSSLYILKIDNQNFRIIKN